MTTCRKPDRRRSHLGARFGIGQLSGYRVGEHLLTRVTWNRIVTRYDRDTDLIEGGVGFRF
jgi:hypothetical protein